MSATGRLARLGITLPAVASPAGVYVPALRHGDLVYTSGQLPTVDGTLVATGKVGEAVSLDEAAGAARTAALNAVAAAAVAAGGIDNIRRVLRVVVYVASAARFTAQPQVANAASNLLGEIFGDDGVHVRSAVGVAVLPLDAPVELELVVEVR